VSDLLTDCQRISKLTVRNGMVTGHRDGKVVHEKVLPKRTPLTRPNHSRTFLGG